MLRDLLFGRWADDDEASYVRPSDHHCFHRTLVEGALDVITVVDHNGSILYESPSVVDHLGFSPDDFVGCNLFELVHVDDLLRVKEAFLEGLRTNTPSSPVEHRLRHTDGSWRSFESVLRFQADPALGRVGIIYSRELGPRKLQEAHMRQAQRMEAAGLSTGVIAHDFNNLLVVISGYAELLGADESPMVRSFANEIRQATERASVLTGQLLKFSRAAQADDETCEVNRVIADVRPILDRMVGRDVRMWYALDASSVPASLGRSALKQVLINLVGNARDSMPAGGDLTVTTTNEWRPRPGDRGAALPLVEYAVIRVTDTGAPLFATKVRARASSVDLQRVSEIVEQAGGTIDVISATGAGTTFRVLLPLQAVPVTAAV